MESLHARVVMNTWTDLMQVVKDSNLNLIPEKLTLQPKFNGQNLNLSACKSILGSKTQFSNCSAKLMSDFKLTNLIDDAGGSCTLEKKEGVVTLSKGAIQIQASFSDHIGAMNTLSLGTSYTLELPEFFVGYEFGVPVQYERNIRLDVSESGGLIAVEGRSVNPNLDFSCKPNH